MKVGVIIEHRTNSIDFVWNYLVPVNLTRKILMGQRLKVIFNNRIVIAFVVKIENKYDYDENLSYIVDVVDNVSFITKRDLNLVKYLEQNFLNRKIDYLNLFVLKFIVANKKEVFIPKNVESLNEVLLEEYNKNGYLSKDYKNLELEKDFILEQKKEVFEKYIQRNSSVRHFENFFEKYSRNKQLQNIKVLLEDQVKIKVSSKILNKINLERLVNEKIVKLSKKQVFFDINLNISQDEKKQNRLNENQIKIANKINLNKYDQYLIQGVTGSGKTHIFIDLINKVNKMGKIAYVLIPEIGLSYKLFEKLSQYIDKTYLYHYKVPTSYKQKIYYQLQKNEVNLIVGTRSTLFLNNKNIGLIIFDEEHDEDYYQSNTPTYDSKILANVIAKNDDFPIIYSSATPSIELKAKNVKTFYLNESFNKFKNTHEIINHNLSKGFFGEKTINKIKENVSKNEQTILLFNKKAYAQYLGCLNCNYVDVCPNCLTTRRVYVNSNKLKCSNCMSSRTIYKNCIKCNSSNLSYYGYGIEKVYHELIQIFNEEEVVYIDAQSFENVKSREQIMKKIENNTYKVIVGTQIISKGFDFKNITLGVVIDADNSLNFPAYYARETTFSLINQFIGRVGRHKQGHIILQTSNPNLNLWKQILTSSYETFINEELNYRQKYKMPPFVNNIYLKVSLNDQSKLFTQIKLLQTQIKNSGFNVSDIYAPMQSKQGLNYLLEFKILYLNSEEKKLKLYLKNLINENKKIKIKIAVNPANWR